MQGHCPYCHQFDPVLKQLAQQYVFLHLDGQGDTAFPEALPVPPDVMQTFFPNIPVATPTTFWSTSTRLRHYRFTGATDAAGFMARMDTVLQMYGGKKRCEISRWCYSLPEYPASRRNNRQPEYPFIHQGLFYPASPVEIVVSLCLTFLFLLCFVGAIVGWISVSEIYYSHRTGRKYRDIPAEMSYAPGRTN